jgi:hypothetical protein
VTTPYLPVPTPEQLKEVSTYLRRRELEYRRGGAPVPPVPANLISSWGMVVHRNIHRAERALEAGDTAGAAYAYAVLLDALNWWVSDPGISPDVRNQLAGG